jgi:hypothetical protein
MDKHSVNKTTEKGDDTWAPLQEVLDYWSDIISDRLAKVRAG